MTPCRVLRSPVNWTSLKESPSHRRGTQSVLPDQVPTPFFCIDEKQTVYSKMRPIGASTDRGLDSTTHMMSHFHGVGIRNCLRWRDVVEQLSSLKKIGQMKPMVLTRFLRFAGQERNSISRMALLLSRRITSTSRRATW